MLFCCGHQLNVASPSGLTQQWEAPGAPPDSPSAGTRAPRAALSGASQSRKCGLLALSIRNKWPQRSHCKLVNNYLHFNALLRLSFGACHADAVLSCGDPTRVFTAGGRVMKLRSLPRVLQR